MNHTCQAYARLLFAILCVIVALGVQPVFGQPTWVPPPNGIPAQGLPIAGKTIPKYVDPLPHFAGLRVSGSSNLTVTMREFQQRVLPSTFVYPAPFTGTLVWGYDISYGSTSTGPLYPGFTVEAQRGVPNTMTYVNNLYNYYDNSLPPFLQQYLTIDQTLHWADPLNSGMMMTPYVGPVPAVVHLHGGEVPSEYDGGPDQWFTPNGLRGASYRSAVPGLTNAAVYQYPNTQEPATLWFHDHALGATRLNVYAGMAAYYLLRDWSVEDPNLPGGPNDVTVTEATHFTGAPFSYKPEIEIAIQDRIFDANGQLYFPNIGINMEHPFWVPEFLGDVIVVNGKTWPYLQVEPRRYRFRVLDGSNARFYNLFLVDAVAGTPGPTIWQIGSDGGLLQMPAALPTLLLGPGERADIIIDFSGFAGKTLLMRNNARSPYPKGTAADPQTVGQIMQFRVGTVVTGNGGLDPSYNPAAGVSPRLQAFAGIGAASTVTRQLTLNEVMGMGGPLEVLVNNSKWNGRRQDGTPLPGSIPDGAGNYVTELPVNGSTETWKIINLTADAHPIHLHLVQFQLVGRQNFNMNKYNKAYSLAFPGGLYLPAYGPPLNYFTGTAGILGGNPDVTPYLQGPLTPPAPNEVGWKDTFIMYPGQVTTVKVRYTAQDGSPFPFDPTTGPGYVWHCHIIDHEDNEMMRPQVVVAPVAAGGVVAMDTQLEETQLAELKSLSPLPETYSMDQNFPNPFNPSTTITFQLPVDSHVNLTVYNSLGQEVKSLIDSDAPAGWHSVQLDATGLASGIYYYRIQAGSFTDVKSMILLK